MMVFSGRPMELCPVLSYADAIIQCWFLGTEAGIALTDILFGRYTPSGRLSMSFPQTMGQVSVYYNHYQTGRPNLGTGERCVSRYLDCPNEPLFPFGYSLSYSDLRVEEQEDSVLIDVQVNNISKTPGLETVQCYVRDLAGSVVRPVMELKDFCQVWLEPGECRRLIFHLSRDQLRFHNDRLEFVFEPGEFEFMVGHSSAKVLKQTLTLC